MSKDIVTATPAEMVADVALRMRARSVGAVLLMDRDVLVGIFTERDALFRVLAAGRDPKTTRVGEVSTRVVITTSTLTPVGAVIRTLRENKSRHLPVVRGEVPVGMLSMRDVMPWLIENDLQDAPASGNGLNRTKGLR